MSALHFADVTGPFQGRVRGARKAPRYDCGERMVTDNALVAHLLDDRGMTAPALLSGVMPPGPIAAELAAK